MLFEAEFQKEVERQISLK
jgi:hypothetical protein